MPKREIVIELYDHTKQDEIVEVLDRLHDIGLDGIILRNFPPLAERNIKAQLSLATRLSVK